MYDREIALANIATDAAMMATATGILGGLITVVGLFKRQWVLSALGAGSAGLSALLLRRYRAAQAGS
jgi:hypothetical protein